MLAQIAEAESLKLEAQRVHAALAAYGCDDLPALPWATPRRLLTSGSGYGSTDVQCIHCGRTIAERKDWQQTKDGPACYGGCPPPAPGQEQPA